MITMIGLVTALPYFIVTSFWIFSLEQNHGVKKVFSNAYNYFSVIKLNVHDAFLLFVSTIHCSILRRNILREKTAKIYEISEIRTFPELHTGFHQCKY